MKRHRVTGLCVLTLFWILVCCQETHPPTALRFRIKKVTTQGNGQLTIDSYSYNSQGRVSSIYKNHTDQRKGGGGFNGNYIYTTNFQYDSQGRLMSLVRPDTGYHTILPARYTYTYDGKGNAVVINYSLNSTDSSLNNRSKTTFYLTYTDSKFPIKITGTEGWTYEYSYDEGNVVLIKKASSGTLSETRTYQFDNKPNPFYGLYIGVVDPQWFKNDHKLTIFYQDNTFSQNNMLFAGCEYSYDAYGNILKIVGSDAVTSFDYEPY